METNVNYIDTQDDDVYYYYHYNDSRQQWLYNNNKITQGYVIQFVST